MAAYLIVSRIGPVRDADALAEYQRRTRLQPPSVPLEPLVVYGDVQALEGQAPDGVVMLRFDSVDDARAWYDHPSYQEALPHRLKAGEYQAFIVEGVEPGNG
ncbi:DUF1330 domain-containing protein [Croceicoccus hydrothermalis]|uniref:DUF1330 domain-containing protein n=1 Tax=Croceicoccus hydrothermalis TaxID=2867964 RepID=UPI001EFA3AC7|nr:DUF1330 domain-containing protein [Croceicoccus hydrothermalis]